MSQTKTELEARLLAWAEELNKRCWSCDAPDATHKTFREASNEYELTCDDCHHYHYPEEYDESRDTLACRIQQARALISEDMRLQLKALNLTDDELWEHINR